MSIWQRIKNLWRLSAIEFNIAGTTPETIIKPMLKKRPAKVVEANELDAINL